MRTLLLSIGLLIFSANLKAQLHLSLDTVRAPAAYENIHVVPIASDSLVSSFVIFVKKEVKAHKHVTHSENVYILEGEGMMTLGDKKFKVKKGDMVVIPKNTVHSLKVTSSKPAKVLSVQSPVFDGKDRVFVE